MRNIVVFLIAVFVISCSPKGTKINYRQQAKIDSKNQITQLSNGALLVKLNTRRKSFEAMRKAGKTTMADKKEAKLNRRNQNIINAFRTNFKFCPVYFFYSDYLRYAVNGQVDSVVFLNDSLQVDLSIKVSSPKYLMAEFGSIYPDTTKYVTNDYFGNGKKEVKHYGGSGLTPTALIIKDNQFAQLKEPFPYFVRERKGLPWQRSIDKIVLMMNNKLGRYYRKNS